MNTAREIVQEIIGAGGELWFDGNRVRGRNIPRRLAVLVKADEGGILAALLSAPAPDNYAIEERLAIQSEDDLPPDRGFDDVPGFEGVPDLTPRSMARFSTGSCIRRRSHRPQPRALLMPPSPLRCSLSQLCPRNQHQRPSHADRVPSSSRVKPHSA